MKIPELDQSQEAARDKPIVIEVAIPSQKRSPFFHAALESVAAVSTPELSLLVFQNAIEPHWQESDLEAFDGSKRLLCSGEALNIGDSWNRVVELCRGDWIHLLHDDDWVEPDFYETFLRDLENHPPFGIWICSTFDEQAGLRPHVTQVPDRYTNDPQEIADVLLEKSGFRCVSVVLNRRAVLKSGGFDRKMRHSLDVDLFFRLACARGVRFCPAVKGHYRIHAASTTGEVKLDRKGRLISLPVLDDHRLLRDHLLFLAKQSAASPAPSSVRRYSASIVWSAGRYYLKRFKVRSLPFWLKCLFRHLAYCFRSQAWS